jgi:ubiquitin-protein ligase
MYGFNNNQAVFSRLTKEFQLCSQDNDLIQIGCNFGLENNNIFTWRVSMLGPVNTPYEGGLFTLLITFPFDYPNHGPEFRFKNKIYHLNVISKDFDPKFGHICVSSINSWAVSGLVQGVPYTVKQALFDIFCLFYNQGVKSAYDENMANDYVANPDQFNEEAKRWTQKYASPNSQ